MRLFSVILLALFASLSTAAPANAKVIRDVIYIDAPGLDPGDVRADVYLPENPDGAPMILMMHGGAWTFGNKQSGLGMFQARYFTSEGFIFISVNYRLAPANPFPAQQEDVAAAIAYFHETPTRSVATATICS